MTDRPRQRAVYNGVVNFFSVSALEKADSRSGGCMRSYHYRYVVGIKDDKEADPNILAGKALHSELAAYLTTGSKHLSALALSGLHIVPDPGPDLLIEQSIDGYVTADGTPLIGELDLSHARGINKGGSDILEINDPAGTVEVIDWKWKRDGSKTEYQLEPNELPRQIQMAGYARYIATRFPLVSNIRLSHGMFFATRGRPRKVTKLVTLDEPMRTWEYVEGLARTIKDVARESDPDKVDANIHACGKYGGCPHRSYCTAYKTAYSNTTTASLFGETLANDIFNTVAGTTGGGSVGIINTLTGSNVSFGTPTNLPQVTIDIKQQLADEEAKLRAQANAKPAMTFAEAWTTIEKSGRGWPALTGAAATQRAALVGQVIPDGCTLTGSGDLISINMSDPAHVIQLGMELAAPVVAAPPPPVVHVQHSAPPISITIPQQTQEDQANRTLRGVTISAPPSANMVLTPSNGVLPPDAPASNPAIAAMPMPGYTLPVGQIPYSQLGTAQPVGVLSPAQQVQAFVQAATTPASAPKRRGRPPKVVTPPQNVPIQMQGSPTPAQMQQLEVARAASTTVLVDSEEQGTLEVFVDCVPLGEYESIHEYVEHLLGVLCDKFIPKEGLRDVRCAPRESALGYAGWKGAIRAIIIEHPPEARAYFVDTRGNEVMEIVADALLVVCAKQGALYVRGVR